MRKVVWCLPAMRFFGQLAADAFGCELVQGAFVGDVDEVHIVGMYDSPLYETTNQATRKAKKRYIHWCGSDVLALQDADLLPEAVHVADSEQLVRELWAKGVEATCVSWPTKHHFPVTPLPEEPQIACYLGTNPFRYGNIMLDALDLALNNPKPVAKVVGYMFGQYTSEQLAQLVEESTCCVRLTHHDGSGATPREFMEAGRRAIITHELPFATRVRPDDLDGLLIAVKRVLKEKEPDLKAAEHYARFNSVERFLEEMRHGG